MKIVAVGLVLVAAAAGVLVGFVITDSNGEGGAADEQRAEAGGTPAATGDAVAALPRERVRLPDGPGREILQQSCSSCHSLTNVVVAREDAEGWDELLTEMEAIGARVPEDARRQLLAYLTENFGDDVAPVRGPVDPAEGPFGER